MGGCHIRGVFTVVPERKKKNPPRRGGGLVAMPNPLLMAEALDA